MSVKIVRKNRKEFQIVENGVGMITASFDRCREIVLEAAAKGYTIDTWCEWQEAKAEQDADRYAEFVASWTCGGGLYEDANIAWHQFNRTR